MNPPFIDSPVLTQKGPELFSTINRSGPFFLRPDSRPCKELRQIRKNLSQAGNKTAMSPDLYIRY